MIENNDVKMLEHISETEPVEETEYKSTEYCLSCGCSHYTVRNGIHYCRNCGKPKTENLENLEIKPTESEPIKEPAKEDKAVFEVLEAFQTKIEQQEKAIIEIKQATTNFVKEISATFETINQNFHSLTEKIDKIREIPQEQQREPRGDFLSKIFSTLDNFSSKANIDGNTQGLSQIQKQILDTAEKTQLIYVRKMLKDAEKIAGIAAEPTHLSVE